MGHGILEILLSGKKTKKAEAERLCAFIISPIVLKQKKLFQVT